MTEIYNKPDRTFLRKMLRNRPTQAESKLWYYLRSKQLGVRFRRQFGIGGYVVDFFAPSHRLVIEVDGSIHDGLDARAYDMNRQNDIEALNLEVMRFTNQRILCNIEEVLDRIRTTICEIDGRSIVLPPLAPPSQGGDDQKIVSPLRRGNTRG